MDIVTKHQQLSEYDRELPQSQTKDQPTAPWCLDAEHRQPHGSKNIIKICVKIHVSDDW